MDTVDTGIISATVSAVGAVVSSVNLWLLPMLHRRRELYFDFFRTKNPYRDQDYRLRIRHEYGPRMEALLWNVPSTNDVEKEYRQSGYSHLLMAKSKAGGTPRNPKTILRDYYLKWDGLQDLYTNEFWNNFWGRDFDDPREGGQMTKPGDECRDRTPSFPWFC